MLGGCMRPTSLDIKEGQQRKRQQLDAAAILSKYLPKQHRSVANHSPQPVFEKTASPKNKKRRTAVFGQQSKQREAVFPASRTTNPHIKNLLADEVICFDIDKLPDSTSPFEELAMEMGAKCVDNLTKAVTVVVSEQSKPGRLRNKAKQMGIKCVGFLWLADCKQNQKRMEYEQYLMKETTDASSLLRRKSHKPDRHLRVSEVERPPPTLPRLLLERIRKSVTDHNQKTRDEQGGFQTKKTH